MKSFSSGSSNHSSSSALISSFLGNDTTLASGNRSMIPHQGALYRIEDATDAATVVYVIDIGLEEGKDSTHELKFTGQEFDFCQKLFAILDTESRGAVDRATVREFVTLRCPVFCRRDDDLRRVAVESLLARQHPTRDDSPTFDEVWKSVVESSRTPEMRLTDEDLKNMVELGVEGWMVFCRFIALAQYLEAKRRFSARHLQQTMRHRNSPRGSEVVVVDVPPAEPPAPLSREQLASYEQQSQSPLPLPELDLDHSLVAAHDSARRRATSSSQNTKGTVKISLFGSSSHHHTVPAYPMLTSESSSANVEFKVSYLRNSQSHDTDTLIVVRRSMEDMKWLNDTFKAHKVLGGTLCGRILPPFPGSSGKVLAAQFQREDTLLNTSIKNTTGGAIAAAAAGVEIIKDVAKSFWKNPTGGTSKPKKKKSSKKSKAKPTPSLCLALPESYYNPNSPAGKARQVERYLNYLLEHPALSTSFPLNTILKASQSGLEAAKQSLEERLRESKEVRDEAPQVIDNKNILHFWGSSAVQPSLSWVRTAAQAAMALKVHGILETTGMQAASARLQHASLPSFESRKAVAWVDEEQEAAESSLDSTAQARLTDSDRASSFEQGVVSVQSELQAEVRPPNDDDGYDLLPLPIPAPERRILSAGSRTANPTESSAAPVRNSLQTGCAPDHTRETRFHYGTSTLRRRLPFDDEDDARSAFLGDISVDEHIDKLREVIGSVDNTLSRCLASSGGIGRARRERSALHLSIVQGFDSWKGLRGKFIGQRALLKGVSGIEQSNEVYEESDLALIDDVSWQTSLANSAVSAAEDVRSAVRAARTAENAKAAANAAAMAAQSTCEAGGFPSIDEARAAQTRASIAQSHAFHAAVVDHEAKAVKRRATLALAHDVKCWNVHRKREMLQACLAHARSQHEATRRAVDAWSCLRDGFIGSNAIPSAQTRKASSPAMNTFTGSVGQGGSMSWNGTLQNDGGQLLPAFTGFEPSATPPPVNVDILSADAFADLLDTQPSPAASSNLNANQSGSQHSFQASMNASGEVISPSENHFNFMESSGGLSGAVHQQSSSEHEEPTATIFQNVEASNNSGDGKPIIVAVDHHMLSAGSTPESSPASIKSTEELPPDNKVDSLDSVMLPFAEPIPPLVTAAPVPEAPVAQEEATTTAVASAPETPSPPTFPPPTPLPPPITSPVQKPVQKEENESMSASMQSLVDGLMSWGGQFETDDVLAIPSGMAASIAFEESDVTGAQSTFF